MLNLRPKQAKGKIYNQYENSKTTQDINHMHIEGETTIIDDMEKILF